MFVQVVFVQEDVMVEDATLEGVLGRKDFFLLEGVGATNED